MCGCFFGEYSNLSANLGCLTHFVGKQGLNEGHRSKKLALALLTPYEIKNKLRTRQPQFFEKIKNSQPELEFTGYYKKKSAKD